MKIHSNIPEVELPAADAPIQIEVNMTRFVAMYPTQQKVEKFTLSHIPEPETQIMQPLS